jgi:quercetin dioxygenase-like cupin family protein
MLLTRPLPAFSDERGDIVDLLSGEEINAVTLVSFREGTLRGNHYHRETIQWNYLISGRLLLRCQLPGAESEDAVLEPGSLAVVGPDERHAFLALEHSVLAVFTRGPRGGKEYESDTYRLDPPLLFPGEVPSGVK